MRLLVHVRWNATRCRPNPSSPASSREHTILAEVLTPSPCNYRHRTRRSVSGHKPVQPPGPIGTRTFRLPATALPSSAGQLQRSQRGLALYQGRNQQHLPAREKYPPQSERAAGAQSISAGEIAISPVSANAHLPSARMPTPGLLQARSRPCSGQNDAVPWPSNAHRDGSGVGRKPAQSGEVPSQHAGGFV